MMRNVKALNQHRAGMERIKPFNFFMVTQARAHSSGPLGEFDLTLYAPFEPDPSRWYDLTWYDSKNGKPWKLLPEWDASLAASGGDLSPEPPYYAVAATIHDLLYAYTFHPEYDWLGPDGELPTRYTRGLQQRRPAHERERRIIGKEADHLDRDENTIDAMFKAPEPAEFQRYTRQDYQRMHVQSLALAVWVSGGTGKAAVSLGMNQPTFTKWEKQAQRIPLAASTIENRNAKLAPLAVPVMLALAALDYFRAMMD